MYNTLFSFSSHFDYFWGLVCYFPLFYIVLLFVIHFLVCSHYLSFFFAIALFVCILFLQYFCYCCYFSSLVGMNIYLCISCSLFYFIISHVCVTQPPLLNLTKSSKATLINTAPLNLTDNALLNVTLKLDSYTVGSIKSLPAWKFLRIKMIMIRAMSQQGTHHLLLNPQAPCRCILVSLNAHPRVVWKPEEAKTHQWFCKGLVTQPKLSGVFRGFCY